MACSTCYNIRNVLSLLLHIMYFHFTAKRAVIRSPLGPIKRSIAACSLDRDNNFDDLDALPYIVCVCVRVCVPSGGGTQGVNFPWKMLNCLNVTLGRNVERDGQTDRQTSWVIVTETNIEFYACTVGGDSNGAGQGYSICVGLLRFDGYVRSHGNYLHLV